MKLRKGKLLPGVEGKRTEEFVGTTATGTEALSVARMLTPPGLGEPARTPDFDEVVIVLKGELTLVVDGKRQTIAEGEMGLLRRGHRVQVRNDGQGACDYYSVCTPAFREELAHVETPAPRAPEANRVTLQVAHPQGKRFSKQVTELAQAFMEKLELSGCELSISLVGDHAIRRLNRTWRKKDKATDVLSFPAGEAPKGTPGPRQLGDVVISLDTAKSQAREYERTLEEEVARYLAHGLLHLLGHDHERPRDAQKMARAEERLLGASGMVGDAVAPRARKLMT